MTLAENKYAPPFTLCLCAMLSGSRSPWLPRGRAVYRLGWEYFEPPRTSAALAAVSLAAMPRRVFQFGADREQSEQ